MRPNSTSSLKLKDTRDQKPFRNKIIFSRNNFHTTGIKLLLKKETAAELQSTPLNQLEDKLSTLRIAAIKGTTTLKEFRVSRDYYKSLVPYPKGKQANQKLDVRDFALDDLEAGKVKAFASDAIILRTLLEEGVKGEAGYRKDRQPLKNQNYVIYPPEPGKYLPNLGKQEYAIAINKNTHYVGWLRKTIDKVLDNADLSQAKEDIKEYENGKYHASVAALPPKAVEAVETTQAVEAVEASDGTKSKKEKNNPFSDPNVVVAIVTAFSTAVPTILIGYWQHGKKNNAKSE